MKSTLLDHPTKQKPNLFCYPCANLHFLFVKFSSHFAFCNQLFHLLSFRFKLYLPYWLLQYHIIFCVKKFPPSFRQKKHFEALLYLLFQSSVGYFETPVDLVFVLDGKDPPKFLFHVRKKHIEDQVSW